jgi:hypothetical protein
VGNFRLPLEKWLGIIERIIKGHLSKDLKTPAHLYQILHLLRTPHERDPRSRFQP